MPSMHRNDPKAVMSERQCPCPSPVAYVGEARILKLTAAVLAILLAMVVAACEGTDNQPIAVSPTTVPTAGSGSTYIPSSPPPLTPTLTATPTAAPDSTQKSAMGSDVWRGLVVAPEDRCSPYDPDEYPYSQSVERQIVASMGGIIYGPYTGMWLDNTSETDIEHIIARSEAHDSGLCAANVATRRQFAADLTNLTLASPVANRSQKSGKDAAEWLPDLNRCWFASRVVEVRQRYDLTIDERERDALESILSDCTSTDLVVRGLPRPLRRRLFQRRKAGRSATP